MIQGWKQKLGYGVFSILVLICMLTVTSVLLNKTGNRRDTNSLEASAKKFLPDIEIDVSTSNNSFTINSTHIESTTTTTTSTTTTTKRISDVEIILNNEWVSFVEYFWGDSNLLNKSYSSIMK